MHPFKFPTYNAYQHSGVDWIGDIPAHWEKLAQKHIFRMKKVLVGKRSSEFELLSLTLRGIVKRDMENPEGKFPAEFDTYQEVAPGDFVFCHFDVEETPRTVGLSEHAGMITGAYTVYVPTSDCDPRYLLYFHVMADTDKKLRGLYKGLRNTISKEVFGCFKMPLPPREEQSAIAAFLDEKSLKIDAAVALEERQIALLKERKQIVIQNAVTKGLNPNAPMKDSGVDWIGEFPAHWTTVPLKRLFSEETERTETGEEVLLSLRMHEGLVPHDDVSDKPISAAELKGYKKVRCGQMVMNRMRASIGLFGLASSSGLVSPDYAIFDIADMVHAPYFLRLFKTPLVGQRFRDASRGLGTGSAGFMRLYTDEFGAISVAVPPLPEQQEIVATVDREAGKIEEAIRLKEQQIANFREYKATLINSAVTGKIKVT